MPVPILLSDQPTGAGAGAAGEGRNDLVAGEVVNLSDTNPANVGASYFWEFEDVPIGSALAALTADTTPTPTFIPDVTGSYRVKCTVNGLDSAVEIYAVPLANTGARIPSFEEELEYDGASNAKGWHEALTVFMRQADSLSGGGGGGGSFGGQDETLEQGFNLFIDDTDSGFVASADNQIDLFIGGVTKLRADATALAPQGGMELGTLAAPWPALYLSQAGTGLVLDTDGDSFIYASADDTVEIEAGATTKFEMLGGGNTFRWTAGSVSRAVLDTGTFRPASAGGIDLGTLAQPFGAVYLQDAGTGLVLDADGDSRIFSDGDDNLQFQTGGADRFEITNGHVYLAGGVHLRPRSTSQDIGTVGNEFRVGYFRLGIRADTDGVGQVGAAGTAYDGVYVAQAGSGFVMDTDGDTYINSAGDDDFRLVVGGATRLEVNNSQIVARRDLVANAAEDLGSLANPWGALYLQQAGTGLVLDTDGDTKLYATADDTWKLEAAGPNNWIGNDGGENFRVVGANSTRFAVNTTRVRGSVAGSSLGELATPWTGLYLQEAGTGAVFDADGDTYIVSPSDDQIQFFAGGVEIARILGLGGGVDGLRPGASNAYDLGSTTRYWRDLFLSSELRPQTTSVALGTTSVGLGAVYMNEGGTGLVLDADNDTYILGAADDDIRIQAGGADVVQVINDGVTGPQLTLSGDLLPDSTANLRDIGSASALFNDAYIDGQINFSGSTVYITSPTTNNLDFRANGNLQYKIVSTFQNWYTNGTQRLSLTATSFSMRNGLTLGTLANPWETIFVQQAAGGLVLDTDGDTYIEASADDVLDIHIGTVLKQRFNSTLSVDFYDTVAPDTDGGQALGFSSRQWGELQIANGSANGIYLDAESHQIYSEVVGGTSSQLNIDANNGGVRASGEVTFRVGGIEVMAVGDTTGSRRVEIAGNMRPATASTYNIGESSFRFSEMHSVDVFTDGLTLAEKAAPTVAADVAEVYAADSGGVTELRVAFDATDHLICDENGNSGLNGTVQQSVPVVSSTAASSSYGTSGVEYVPLVQGAADSVEFQFIASGDFTIEVVYAMSVANAGDIDLRLDSLAVGDGSDPNTALSTGTVTTFVPGADVLRHTAASANFDVTASPGDVVRCLLERPNTDTHTGDVRILDIRVVSNA